MRKAVGLRNLLVHQYQKVNWDIVWSVINHHLDDSIDFVNAVLQWAQEQGAGEFS
jgi:uncharacterized protein with HEPN domain